MRGRSESRTGASHPVRNQCGICLEEVKEAEAELACHLFHSNCLKQFIRSQLTSRIFPIRCPQEDCDRQLPIGLVTPIEPAILQKNLEASLREYIAANRSRIVFCPGLDCRYLFEYVDSCPLDHIIRLKVCLGCLKPFCKCKKTMVCPCCRTTICLLCRQSHLGLSCEQHRWNQRIDLDFNKFVECIRKHELKKCPKCQSWVEKSEGCNHMVCRCRHEFCYRCNGRYGSCVCLSSPQKEVDVTHIYPKITRPFRGVTSSRPVKTLPNTRQLPTKPSEASRLKIQKFPFWVRMMKNKQL